jgi:hypothetical protein
MTCRGAPIVNEVVQARPDGQKLLMSSSQDAGDISVVLSTPDVAALNKRDGVHGKELRNPNRIRQSPQRLEAKAQCSANHL